MSKDHIFAVTADLREEMLKALNRAWQLGQIYWGQADSESYSQNKKSEDTRAKFLGLVDDVVSLLTPAEQPSRPYGGDRAEPRDDSAHPAEQQEGGEAKDAARLKAMAAEWDRARRGVDSSMPIWDALCEAVGDNADGNGMRAAIDAAVNRSKERT